MDLMGGTFDLSVDGDLFKAQLSLPTSSGATPPQSEPEESRKAPPEEAPAEHPAGPLEKLRAPAVAGIGNRWEKQDHPFGKKPAGAGRRRSCPAPAGFFLLPTVFPDPLPRGPYSPRRSRSRRYWPRRPSYFRPAAR